MSGLFDFEPLNQIEQGLSPRRAAGHGLGADSHQRVEVALPRQDGADRG